MDGETIQIDALPFAEAVSGAELFPVMVGGMSKTLTLDQIVGQALQLALRGADNLADVPDPAAARVNLSVPSLAQMAAADQQRVAIADLPTVYAVHHGVTGNQGEDQTAQLQNIIDNVLPAEGGTIEFQGWVDFTSLDLSGRRNIVFRGSGGNGTGAAQQAVLRSLLGSGTAGTPAVKCWQTFGIRFESMMLLSQDPGFNGVLVDYNPAAVSPGEDSALMSMRDVYVQIASAAATAIDLYGATQGSFENLTLQGPGRLLKLQDVTGVGFCNLHRFANVYIKPSGTIHPVFGSGEGITFQSCNVQASTGDGRTRFWETSQNQPFKGITIQGCTTYDPVADGGIQCQFYRGYGLTMIGNLCGGFSGGANYFATIGGGPSGASEDGYGVSGIVILGNVFEYFTAAISFQGSAANNNQGRYGLIAANACRGTMPGSVLTGLVRGIASSKRVLVLPNEILDAGTAALMDALFMYDWPAYASRAAAVAAGRTTGQVFKETTSGNGYLCVV